MRVAGMVVGTALIFIGFLDVFLSISGGFEIDVIPFMIYFGGVAVWANSVVENTTLRYSIIGGAIVLAAVFFHYGEVLFWHKQVLFWSTVVVVMYFMFNEPKNALIRPVCLSFGHLVCLVHLVSFVHPNTQDRLNRRDRPNRSIMAGVSWRCRFPSSSPH